MKDKSTVWVEEVLGYTFKQLVLLDEALTHGSAGVPDYERLEFLGDRVLGLAITELLLEAFPDADEGELGRRHASLARTETLAAMAARWGLAAHMRFVGDDVPAGVLADGVEAMLGAIHADGGYAAVRNVIASHWSPLLDAADDRDAKTRLQELLQAQREPLPVYEVVESWGQDHARQFRVVVKTVRGEAQGEGPNKQAASMAAAANLLETLE